MPIAEPADTVSRRRGALALALAAGAAALFAWSVRAAGPGAVLDGVRRVGGWFAIVLLLGGLRHLARSAAWRWCLDDPRRFPLRSAFAAVLGGNSVGTITPFGLLVSEPSKIVFAGGHLPIAESVAALTIENLCYSATVLVVLASGATALLLSTVVPLAARTVVVSAVLAAAAAFGIVSFAVLSRRRVLTILVERLTHAHSARHRLEARLARARAIEDRIFAVASWPRRRLWPILAAQTAHHVAAVAEIWIVVFAITGAHPGVLPAFILESVNRAITVGFQFVPLWLGVDEAASGLVADIMGLGPATGVSLALVRKARILSWTAVGLTIAFARRGESVRRRV